MQKKANNYKTIFCMLLLPVVYRIFVFFLNLRYLFVLQNLLQNNEIAFKTTFIMRLFRSSVFNCAFLSFDGFFPNLKLFYSFPSACVNIISSSFSNFSPVLNLFHGMYNLAYTILFCYPISFLDYVLNFIGPGLFF